jgi:hypothetical protein
MENEYAYGTDRNTYAVFFSPNNYLLYLNENEKSCDYCHNVNIDECEKGEYAWNNRVDEVNAHEFLCDDLQTVSSRKIRTNCAPITPIHEEPFDVNDGFRLSPGVFDDTMTNYLSFDDCFHTSEINGFHPIRYPNGEHSYHILACSSPKREGDDKTQNRPLISKNATKSYSETFQQNDGGSEKENNFHYNTIIGGNGGNGGFCDYSNTFGGDENNYLGDHGNGTDYFTGTYEIC